MDGNSAKNAPVLDHLVDTSNITAAKPASAPQQANTTAKQRLVFTAVNGAQAQAAHPQANVPPAQNIPNNRRTDKSEFEIELTKTVNRIMVKYIEHASEEIVTQVLNEVRARLPGQKKP